MWIEAYERSSSITLYGFHHSQLEILPIIKVLKQALAELTLTIFSSGSEYVGGMLLVEYCQKGN